MSEDRYQSVDRLDTRYRARLREEGFRADEPIDLDELMWGGVGTFDTIEKCFVKKNERSEWVPE